MGGRFPQRGRAASIAALSPGSIRSRFSHVATLRSNQLLHKHSTYIVRAFLTLTDCAV